RPPRRRDRPLHPLRGPASRRSAPAPPGDRRAVERTGGAVTEARRRGRPARRNGRASPTRTRTGTAADHAAASPRRASLAGASASEEDADVTAEDKAFLV